MKKKSNPSSIYLNFLKHVQRVAAIINSIQRTATPDTIRSSFYKVGVIQDFFWQPQMIMFGEKQILKNIDGQQSTNISFSNNEENYSSKRRMIKFGFINKTNLDQTANGICPFCFLVINSDDEEFDPETQN